MKLANVARYFDTIDTFDGYTGRYLFKSQPGSFESSSPEGSVSKRRVLSVAPGITMPARRCVTVLNETWLVGDSSQDGLLNQILRQSFWMRKVSSLYTIRTPGQGALASGGSTAYGMREYLKDTVNAQTNAEYDAQYMISFVAGEGVTKGYILSSATELYHVRNVYIDQAGFFVATADDIQGAAVTATFISSTLNVVTDVEATISTAVSALMFEPPKLFEYGTHADPLYVAGDMVMLVAASSITPIMGQKLTASSVTWRIEALRAYNDAWLLHLRKA